MVFIIDKNLKLFKENQKFKKVIEKKKIWNSLKVENLLILVLKKASKLLLNLNMICKNYFIVNYVKKILMIHYHILIILIVFFIIEKEVWKCKLKTSKKFQSKIYSKNKKIKIQKLFKKNLKMKK